MKQFNFIVVTIFVLCAMSLAVVTDLTGAAEQPGETAAGSSINSFALDVYKHLKKPDENVFFSPYGAFICLSMAYAGAAGDTERQMAKTLHFEQEGPGVHDAIGSLNKLLEAAAQQPDTTLTIANALWGQNGYHFLPVYLELLKAKYRGGLREVDFKDNPNSAVAAINKWAEKETQGRIKDILSSVDPLTRLILTNAIYFKGKWQEQFDKKSTKDQPFTLLDGNKITVPLMTQKKHFSYMEENGFQALELSYRGNLSMVVFLPADHKGLPAFEQAITNESLSNWLSSLKRTEVLVYLPKFEMNDFMSLTKGLKSLGMTDAFSNKADFSKMVSKEKLYISDVLQKTFAKVDEEGTEAAAVTATRMVTLSGMPNKRKLLVFRADRPFMFMIRHVPTGSIFFMGRVMRPS
ncbi:MAG: serpin family protein [Desulfomonilaceae bacterium]